MKKENKHIVLIHGLYMPALIMQYLDKHFRKRGFKTHKFGYNSLRFPSAAKLLNRFVNSRFDEHDQVYFFGHSLGGLLIRHYFQTYQPQFSDTCIITAGTPHNGATIAKFFSSNGLGFIFGSSENILNNGLGDYDIDVPIGVITGTYDAGVGRVMLGKNQGDGTVTIEDANLKGATDTCSLNLNHTALVYSKEVVELSARFIEKKSFN
ncbi:esterase/lipase family protein [Vibrio maerlii]|uniref:esterase/lipase family protein n=1 Tax=Vibrio maerlii TaxID=2231648 RepID=UPI000E3E96F9|nr:acetyltransferase [Vibrio maerlii]